MAIQRGHHRHALPLWVKICAVAAMFASSVGCNSILNSWLDPSVLGNFSRTAMLEIRTSLTLEDTPPGIPGAVSPLYDDLVVRSMEYPISAGDTLAIEVFELRERAIPFQTQAVVSLTGYVNLPVVGRLDASGLTVPQFEGAIEDALREQEVLLDPEVTVNPLFLQNATYSIFGIGVSAANDAPLRAGTFPIRRPDLRVLEAINQVGGLNEFVTDVYIFRYDTPPWVQGAEPGPALEEVEPPTESADEPAGDETGVEPSAASPVDELIEVVVEGEQRQEEVQEAEEPVWSEEVLKSLEPEPTDPYIFVDGRFVPNPAYTGPAGGAVSAGQDLPTFDTATPAVNWARIAGDTSYRVIRVEAQRLRLGDPEVNIVVRAGDVIRIVSGEIGVYYVMGQVNRVGAFAFNAEAITLKAAIAAAGGLSSLAWPDRCTVYRRLGQREQMIQVDLDRIFAGKDPDFYIKRSDIINVGTHPFAPFLQRIRAWTLPNPVTNVGYSYTYARNYADIDSYSARINPHNEPDRFPALFP